MLKNIMDQWQQLVLRTKLELIVAVIIVSCACSVFLSTLRFQTQTSLDQGKLTYVGQMQRGKLDGQGTLTFENGDRYQGQFVKGKLEGQGTFTSVDGWVYEGHFYNGQAHGQGKLTTEAAIVYEGQFKEGIYQDEN